MCEVAVSLWGQLPLQSHLSPLLGSSRCACTDSPLRPEFAHEKVGELYVYAQRENRKAGH